MIQFIGVSLLLSLSLYAEGDISFGGTNKEKLPVKSLEYLKELPQYTLQVFSVKTLQTAERQLKKIPPKLRKGTKLYKSGSYITARFSNADSAQSLKKYIESFQKSGYRDAYIIKTTKWHMLHNQIKHKGATTLAQEKVKQITPNQAVPQKLKIKKKSVSKYLKSGMLLKADAAYKSGDVSTAMIYYEMILNSGYATQKIKNNLCYLYGTNGAWFEAKEIIDKERYISKFLYAYAYGALQSNQENFLETLAENILLDKSGRLALLAGSYYEQREEMQRAVVYYKLAHEKKPSDIYTTFAYARVLDIQKDYALALKYYKKASLLQTNNANIHAIIHKRIQELKE